MSTVVANLGPALRQAWVGYRRRLDAELASAGFADQSLPDGRVLHICASPEPVTISHIGRELSISRQGAAKIVTGLQQRQYVTLSPSPTSGREKIVALTARGTAYLAARRKAARRIEQQLRRQLGADHYDALHVALEAIGGSEQPRMSEYLRRARDWTTSATWSIERYLSCAASGEISGRADGRAWMGSPGR